MIDRVALRPREVSRILGVSLRTVHNWIRHRQLPAKKVGRVTLIPLDALQQWLNKLGGSPSAPAASGIDRNALLGRGYR